MALRQVVERQHPRMGLKKGFRCSYSRARLGLRYARKGAKEPSKQEKKKERKEEEKIEILGSHLASRRKGKRGTR